MQEKDERKAKSMASTSVSAPAAPQNPNSKLQDNPPKVREEGELTSSDDDALLMGSAAPPLSTSVPNASVVSSVQGVNSGKSTFVSVPAGSAHIQSQVPGYRKGFSKNQVLLKSSNPGWLAPSANDNLVISFSDDDHSSSDGEERRQEKILAIDRHPLVVNSNRKPPALPQVKQQAIRKTAKNEGKVVPKKVSLSRTFISSMNNIHESSVRSGGSSLADQKYRLKNSNVAGRVLPGQDPGCSKNTDMSSSKLQDLRQQIAMRENELKLKLTQQNKENVSGTCGIVMGQSKFSSRKSKAIATNVQTEPKEPDRKRLKTDASGVTVSCSLSDWISKPMETLAMPKQTESLTKANPAYPADQSIPKHAGVISKNQPSRSAPYQNMDANTLNKVHDSRDAVSAFEKVKSTSDSGLQALSLQASPDDSSHLQCLGRSTVSGSGDVDLQSLFEIEELHDKELEEAQEHRRRCEAEERNALNAYRKAQRALLEANARCTYLYGRRELYSAQLHSFLMEDSSLLYSSRQHSQTGDKWNLANNISESLDLIPSSRQLHDGFKGRNQLGYDSNVQSADGDAYNRFSGNEDGHNLGSEACSEPDASSSELLVRGNNFAANGIHSPSSDRNLSPDDDLGTSLDPRSLHADASCPRTEDNSKESEKDMYVDSATNFSMDGSRDPLFLEEYLRSKLISRLGVSSSKHSGIGDKCESAAEKVAEEGVAGAKTRMIVDGVSLSDPNVSIVDSGAGLKKPEGSEPKPPFNTQIQPLVEEHSLNDSPVPSFHPEDCYSIDNISTSITSLSSIFRSVMKAVGPVSSDGVQIKEPHYCTPDTCNDDGLIVKNGQDNLHLEKGNSAGQLVKHVSFGSIDSYSCKSAINPFWPLCMYELRGRCNNDECPWQHVEDYSSRNMDSQYSSDSTNCQTGWSSNFQNQRVRIELSSVLTPPKYLVCLDSLKDELHTNGSLPGCHVGSSRKNVFSHSLAVPRSLLKHLPSDEPCLHGNDGCVESYSGGGHSLYFQSRNSAGIPLRNGAENDQALEMALVILSQEVNKIEGVKKALSLLSRALEADSTSIHYWIVYLLLYYSTKNSVAEVSKKSSVQEDDFFSHAVKHNERSYELWLLYINSRTRLNERFAAYERALSRLCHHASANDGNVVHRSAAILDLFLQMLYCFCVSGNFVKAVQRIYRLVHADRDSDESHSLSLSDILQCLTVSDKCVFWVCCVYLVIYRKLPHTLVQQFEFEKDISLIQWPSVHVTLEEKQQVSKLMKMAIDSVGMHINSQSPDSGTLKSAHLLAVNHVKLTAAIDDEESCKMFIDKYRNSFPSCLDLIILSARAHGSIVERTNFEGFEKALSNWPKDVLGSHCIWNQLAEYALDKGRPDRASEIMDQWFHSVWKPQFHNQSVDAENCDNKNISVDLLSGLNLNAVTSYSNMDLVFGLLNLSLYKLFQNGVLGAHMAIDKALRVADAEVSRHCVREHAAFLFNNGSKLGKDITVRGLLDILRGYMSHARATSASDPLTRKFIQHIRRPRLRQLVSNILSPLSPDSSLVNSVLEIWFGSSLLPQKSNELKDMVDFVEAILEVTPANYQLVISACKLLCRDSGVGNTRSESVLFWASSSLVNTIYHAVPVPPEHVWVEATDLLGKLTNVQKISESFCQRALSVYPFSINLWKSFLNISTDPGKRSSVVEAAREKGLELE